jgi:hypothetical protein
MQSQVTHEEDKLQDVPDSLPAGTPSEAAKRHTRAFSMFYMWAAPLFDLGHVKVRNQAIAFDLSISRRFMISNEDGRPILEAQAPEMRWIELLPFTFAGLDRNHNALLLFAKPEAPLREFVIAIPFDVPEKLELFSGQKRLKIQMVDGNPTAGFTRREGKFIVLEIRDVTPKKAAPKKKP